MSLTGIALPGAPVPAIELEILLECARGWRDPARPPRLTPLTAGGVDWSGVLRMAAWHGVMPLVHRAVERSGGDAVPVQVAHRLRTWFDANAAHSLRLTAHLQGLLAFLEGHGISAIPYKGPALAVAAYGSLLLRVFGDLDILVPKEQLTGAMAALHSAGYRSQLPLTPGQERILIELERPGGFVDATGVVAVELHPAVTPRYLAARVDHRRLCEDLETLSLGESRVRSFVPHTLLLVLCLHATKHLWTRLLWLCDVAELIRARPDLNWNRLTALAREWGTERILRLGILLATDLLEARPPDDVRRWAMADAAARSLAQEVRGRLSRPAGPAPGVAAQARFQLRALEHWRDRLQYCRFVARPSEADWTCWSLPAPLRALYYPLRAARLLVRGPGSPR